MSESVILMSGFALQGAIESDILPIFERDTGISIDARWAPTTLAVEALNRHAEVDVVVLADDAIESLAVKGTVLLETIVALASATIGLGVRKGESKPDISTVDAFRASLLAANSIAYSKAGASGIYFEKLIERLGIADAVRQKSVVIPSGYTGEQLINGEADIAIQQISELVVVPGVEVVGAFPDDVASVTGFSAAVVRSSRRREQSEQLIKTLSSPEAMTAYSRAGLTPRK